MLVIPYYSMKSFLINTANSFTTVLSLQGWLFFWQLFVIFFKVIFFQFSCNPLGYFLRWLFSNSLVIHCVFFFKWQFFSFLAIPCFFKLTIFQFSYNSLFFFFKKWWLFNYLTIPWALFKLTIFQHFDYYLCFCYFFY